MGRAVPDRRLGHMDWKYETRGKGKSFEKRKALHLAHKHRVMGGVITVKVRESSPGGRHGKSRKWKRMKDYDREGTQKTAVQLRKRRAQKKGRR